jgi:hypothetical protein
MMDTLKFSGGDYFQARGEFYIFRKHFATARGSSLTHVPILNDGTFLRFSDRRPSQNIKHSFSPPSPSSIAPSAPQRSSFVKLRRVFAYSGLERSCPLCPLSL